MKKAILITGLMMIALLGNSQGFREGYVEVRQDPMLDTLLVKYQALRSQIENYQDNKGISGYRIQIFFDSGTHSGERARQVKEEFETFFPGIPGYVTWKAPNFRVRVGDFRSRLEAEKALMEITRKYPNAWVIKDEINYPPI